MPNQPPLNPDALHQLFAVAMMEVLDAEKLQPGNRLAHVNDIQEVLNRLEKSILAAAQPEVTSVEELDALPIGSVIIDKHGDVGLIDRDGTIEKCVQFAETIAMSIGYTAKHFLPARVLYCPEVNDA